MIGASQISGLAHWDDGPSVLPPHIWGRFSFGSG